MFLHARRLLLHYGIVVTPNVTGKGSVGVGGKVSGGITAWGDESYYGRTDPPMYLLAATVFGDNVELGSLMRVKPTGAPKLHWRDMPPRLQVRSLAALTEIDQATTIVIAAPLERMRQERGRRLCLRELLRQLECKGVCELVLESRGKRMDMADVELAANVGSSILVRHLPGRDEPRLWIPDQILGAWGDTMLGVPKGARWEQAWERVKASVALVTISP